MKIGELAQLAGCTTDTIRFYEKEGLLPAAARTGANYRYYSDAHLQRLRFIRNCRALDMSHEEIRRLLDAGDARGEDCAAINQLIDEHIDHVVKRIDELTSLKQQLLTLRAHCQTEKAVLECGIMQELGAMEASAAHAHHGHV
ncbi:Cd(II)/Pb(II)-responsive transcriptional regulator [Paraburkholderia humisilvae]|uniref:HTH-type transcriptional regulator ZntR n=1 Tax=Paraburkholderia humisilvae TaxID=627669 RepID=A0A6J5D8M6_9BURK|nr:Cd(II)/Pb(II)-responsive transcriptional regulator [Paraburkholderia humisilvae]CAB3749096.1 HTH-type transcriptional regulator ZntR [Paraburkholderia humisilvae]